MLAYFLTPVGFWYGFVYTILFSVGLQSALQCFFLVKMAKAKPGPIQYIVYLMQGYLLFFLAVVLPPLSDFFGSLLALVAIFLFARCLLRQSWSASAFLACLMLSVTVLVEGVLTPLLSLLVRLYPLGSIALTNISLCGTLVLSAAIFLLYTKYFAIDETIKSKALVVLSAPLLFICLVLRPYLALRYPSIFRHGQALSDTRLTEDVWFFVLTVVALLAVSSILFAYKTLLSQAKAERDALLLHTQVAAQESYVAELRQRYDATRGFRHDFNNHLLVLEGLLAENDCAQAKRYLSRFRDCHEEMRFPIATGNASLDILLGEKLHLATQHGLTVSVDIAIGERVRLDDFDLCTLFANAIDNAIKGARSAGSENRGIEIRAGVHRDFFIIDLRNGFAEEGYEKSSGLGLATIQMIAEKYRGYVDISQSDETFRLSILLPFAP